MATEDTLDGVITKLDEWGFTTAVTATGTAGSFAPVSALLHSHGGHSHTGGSELDPIPANFTVDEDGLITLVNYGQVAHSGYGNADAAQKIIAGIPLSTRITPGPTELYTMDAQALSVVGMSTEEWTAPQLTSIVALSAALVETFGWDDEALPVAGAKEFSRDRSNSPENYTPDIRLAAYRVLHQPVGGGGNGFEGITPLGVALITSTSASAARAVIGAASAAQGAKADTAVQPADLDAYATEAAVDAALVQVGDALALKANLNDPRFDLAGTAVQPDDLSGYVVTTDPRLSDKRDATNGSVGPDQIALGYVLLSEPEYTVIAGFVPVPPGGTAGQVLTKVDAGDGHIAWADATGGSPDLSGYVTDAELATALVSYVTSTQLADEISLLVRSDDPRLSDTRTPTDASVTEDKVADGLNLMTDAEQAKLAKLNLSGATDQQVLSYDQGTDTWTARTVSTGGVGATELADLTDVSVASPADGDVLRYRTDDGTWHAEPLDSSTLDSMLAGLPAIAGQVLTFDGASWVPAAPAAGGAEALDDLTDVNLSTAPTVGQALVFDGTAWSPGTVASGGATDLDGLTDVNLTTPPAEGQALVYRGGEWHAETPIAGLGEYRHETVAGSPSYDYSGAAVNGSAETAAVWTITRIDLSTLVITTATAVAWTDRLTVSYS